MCGTLAGMHDEVESTWPSGPVRVFDDVDANFALRALAGPYLPWGSGSMRPAGLVEVCNDVVLNDRRNIVELGSGVSTVLLARLLAQRGMTHGRRLVAVEHDARWRRWVVGQLRAEGVDGDVVVVEAPLQPIGDGDGPRWYDEAAIDAAIETIDLLVVDGPPAFAPGLGLARHRALTVLRDRLVPGATVVLDDVERSGEQEVLRRWEHEFGLTFRHVVAAGVAIATVP
jgi:hypothetical protein